MNFFLKRHLLKDNAVKILYKTIKNADLWACVAAAMFKIPYEQCLEYDKDNNPQPNGKILRTFAKRLVLYTRYPQRGFYKVSDMIFTCDLDTITHIVKDYQRSILHND